MSHKFYLPCIIYVYFFTLIFIQVQRAKSAFHRFRNSALLSAVESLPQLRNLGHVNHAITLSTFTHSTTRLGIGVPVPVCLVLWILPTRRGFVTRFVADPTDWTGILFSRTFIIFVLRLSFAVRIGGIDLGGDLLLCVCLEALESTFRQKDLTTFIGLFLVIFLFTRTLIRGLLNIDRERLPEGIVLNFVGSLLDQRRKTLFKSVTNLVKCQTIFFLHAFDRCLEVLAEQLWQLL
ncbi:unnamed protein product [Amoebophrya sp. A25]|nr:unnamed protein product [Amoebophrya sp. A25]CAD7931051.1 unnamed protein product [Amoebophrya sp. A25]CAD7940514.1 unnamed protein product [Amoebophrya sp. A25]CAD7942187.1 unnamed protein product [Amoebophrya sp. A25]CAD7943745.1 unnamed protein product [Amoebophrya sp. A25]|eukprot:GSA25T00007468001.1